MGESTGISWTDHTFNPWWGCQRVSPGCEHCYAETFSKRVGLKVWGPKTERRFFGDKHWNEPRKWNAAAERAGVRRRVFCASMADVFEDRPELVGPRKRVLDLVRETPNLDWLLLTKRPENVNAMVDHYGEGLGLPTNVWMGTTVEDQRRADERIPHLLQIHARVRFLSCEPMLEDVSLFAFLKTPLRDQSLVALGSRPMPGVDWVIVGGESGPGARPFNPTWARDIVNACRAAKVACFVKQLGANVLDFAGAITDRKGGDMGEFPPELRVREFPEVRS